MTDATQCPECSGSGLAHAMNQSCYEGNCDDCPVACWTCHGSGQNMAALPATEGTEP